VVALPVLAVAPCSQLHHLEHHRLDQQDDKWPQKFSTRRKSIETTKERLNLGSIPFSYFALNFTGTNMNIFLMTL
jgi:hypothetical protein